MTNEPSRLRRGKEFHKLIQDEWEREAQGDIISERHIIKPNGRRGRIDIFVNDDDPESSVAIVEIKATDWDKIAPKIGRASCRERV